MIEIFQSIDLGENLWKFLILANVFRNSDFGPKLGKIHILVKKILVKFCKILTLVIIIGKSGFLSQFTRHMNFSIKIFENLDFVENHPKSQFWSKLSNISIAIYIFENLDFGQNVRKISSKISILIAIFEKKLFR